MKKPLISLVLLLASTASQATLINYSGDFSGTFPTGSAVPTISGSWSVLFDDSGLSGSGSERPSVTPISFSLTTNLLGVTAFDSSNVGVELFFFNGSLLQISVGGLIQGVTGASGNIDDFIATYNSSGRLVNLRYSVATEPTLPRATTLSGGFAATAASIPEPSTLALMAIGLTAIGFARYGKRQGRKSLERTH